MPPRRDQEACWSRDFILCISSNMQDDLYFGVITGPMVPWHIPASLRAGGEGGSGSRFWEAGEDRLVGALKSTPCSPTQTIILGIPWKRDSTTHCQLAMVPQASLPPFQWCWFGIWSPQQQGCCWLCSGCFYSDTITHCRLPGKREILGERGGREEERDKETKSRLGFACARGCKAGAAARWCA